MNLRRSPSPKRRRREEASPTRATAAAIPLSSSSFGGGNSTPTRTSTRDYSDILQNHHHLQHHHQHPSRPANEGTSSISRYHSYNADSTTIHAAFYDVVLQADGPSADGSNASPEDILPRLGTVLLNQSGQLDGDEYGHEVGSDGFPRSGSGSSIVMIAQGGSNNKTLASAAAIAQADVKFERKVKELLNLEKSYVRRIEALYHDYALPLRQLAREKDKAIIPLYEAHKLFGNISEILSCSQAFLYELEMILRDGIEAARRTIGAVLYKHIIMFSCYKEYIGNFDKDMISSLMKGRALRDFVDRTRQASVGIGNSGLTELLMEPVQRIPRYKLLFAELIAQMLRPTDEDQLLLLRKALTTIDEIAMCEADEETKKAAILWSFSRNVDGFPPGLISAKRGFVDAIDVDDFPLSDLAAAAAMSNPGLFSPLAASVVSPFSPQTPGLAAANLSGAGGSSSSSTGRPIPCTLLLFDDRLVIAKRASSSTCGRRAVGLEDLTRLASAMKWNPEGNGVDGPGGGGGGGYGYGAGGISGSAAGAGGSDIGGLMTRSRIELGFRGVVDLMDVTAVDLGGPDFQLGFGRSPEQTSGEKWTGRLVRNYAAADYAFFPGSAAAGGAMSSVAANGSSLVSGSSSSSGGGGGSNGATLTPGREEKARFLENLYRAQALFKARDQKSQVRVLAVAGSESRAEVGRKLVFWNVYSRRAYLYSQHKAPVVLHIDLTGRADPIPFGPEHHAPHARLRIYSLDLALGKCFHTTSIKGVVDDDDDQQPLALLMADLPGRLAEVSDEARTLNDFAPPRRTDSIFSTPSTRGRSVVQGLENFRRSLLFGGSSAGGGTPSHARAGSGPGALTSSFMGSEPFLGSPSKRTKSSTSRATTDTISSVFSHATSNFRGAGGTSTTGLTSTTSNGAASVNSRDMLMMSGDGAAGMMMASSSSASPYKLSMPAGLMSPRKLQKKKRSSSVGAPDPETQAAMAQAQTGAGGGGGTDTTLRYSSHFTARLKGGVDEQENQPGSGPGTPSQPRQSTRQRVQSTPMQDLLNLRASAVADAETIASLKRKVEALEQERANAKPLQTQVRMLTRKVEVLAVLEKDGQLENTELHKAFNEELDGLYEHTQKPESEELIALRVDAKKTKAERNEYSAMVRALKRELELERGEKAIFKAILEENGLL
ncbi:hypothetical protein V8E36_007647 [Tilletia maclaganii]